MEIKMDNDLVLVADIDKQILNLVTITLKAHDYKCITASSGEGAILLTSANNPSIVILELSLPDLDGTEVIRTIRSWSDVPIIVISSRCEDHDKVMALDAGADDYLTKPFSIEELMARLRVMKRRFAKTEVTTASSSVFYNGSLKIDYVSGCTYINGKEIHLTPIEYKLLCIFSQNIGRVLTNTFITKEIWGSSWESNILTLRTFMASLRKKLDPKDKDRYIKTHTGVGYRMIKTE